jgi:hypothetical protein
MDAYDNRTLGASDLLAFRSRRGIALHTAPMESYRSTTDAIVDGF